MAVAIAPFNITVYTSSNGASLDTPLEVRAGDTSLELHILTVSPTFADPQYDYYMIAKVDSDDAVAEYSEDDNAAVFQKGAFIDREAASGQTVLHIEGSDAADPVSVAEIGYNRWQVLMPRSSISVPGGSSPPPYYDVIGNGIVNMMDIAAPPHSDLLWQNANRFDVNRDYYTTAADALAIINALNAWGERALYDQPQASDPLYDVSGDGILSVLDANQVIDVLNGGDGTVGAPWRNPVNPFDVNGDGTVGWLGEAQPILDFLALGQINYTNLALDQIHIRTHGGDDTAAVDGAIAWLFGGAGDNTLTGGSFDNYISAGDGANIITGGIGENTIEVGDGNNNLIIAGDAGDIITAGNGDNTITGGGGGDYISVGNGNNAVSGGDGGNTIAAGNGSNNVVGGNGGDYIAVGSGDNSIAGGAGSDIVMAGSGANQINAGGGNDQVSVGLSDEPTEGTGADFSNHSLVVSFDWHRIADAILDTAHSTEPYWDGADGSLADERYVQVTLKAPDGLYMSQVRSVPAAANITGDTGDVSFPIADPESTYTIVISPSPGLSLQPVTPDGLPADSPALTFNSSDDTIYNQEGNYELDYQVLSTGLNFPNVPAGYHVPIAQDPEVLAHNVYDGGEDGFHYVVSPGGTLTIDTDENGDPVELDQNGDPTYGISRHGVLCGDRFSDPPDFEYANASMNCGWYGGQQVLSAEVTDQPRIGQLVSFNSNGSFTYRANDNAYGQDFFRIIVHGGGGYSLKATVYVQVTKPVNLIVRYASYTPSNVPINQRAVDWVAYFVRDSAKREQKSVKVIPYLTTLQNQAQLDEWNDKVGVKKVNDYVIVTMTVDDKLLLAGSPGQGSGYKVTLNPSSMKSEFNRTSRAIKGGWDQFVGVILAHEGLYHGLRATHFYNFVNECSCIDAHVEPYNGGLKFSNEASKAIWPKLGIQ